MLMFLKLSCAHFKKKNVVMQEKQKWLCDRFRVLTCEELSSSRVLHSHWSFPCTAHPAPDIVSDLRAVWSPPVITWVLVWTGNSWPCNPCVHTRSSRKRRTGLQTTPPESRLPLSASARPRPLPCPQWAPHTWKVRAQGDPTVSHSSGHKSCVKES